MSSEAPIRTRREPPRFRLATVRRVAQLTPHMSQVALAGDDLEGFSVDQPAASIRLLIPSPGSRDLVIPTWNGNEFLLADGTRPAIRTFTPRRVDSEAGVLELEIVLHDGGATSDWVRGAAVGDPAAISGPGRGYAIDHGAPAFLVAGDESAIPAISQLLEFLSGHTPVNVFIEVAHPDARLTLPHHPLAAVEWCDLAPGAPPGDALFDAMQGADLVEGVRVWAAGEAAAMHRIRRYLFEDRGLSRSQAAVRGYWKRQRSNSADGSN